MPRHLLEKLRLEAGLTKKSIADILNMTPEGYSYYEKGTRTPSIDVIETLAEYYNVSTDYLLGISNTPIPPSSLKGYVSLEDETVQIPVLGKVAAGKPIHAEEEIIDY